MEDSLRRRRREEGEGEGSKADDGHRGARGQQAKATIQGGKMDLSSSEMQQVLREVLVQKGASSSSSSNRTTYCLILTLVLLYLLTVIPTSVYLYYRILGDGRGGELSVRDFTSLLSSSVTSTIKGLLLPPPVEKLTWRITGGGSKKAQKPTSIEDELPPLPPIAFGALLPYPSPDDPYQQEALMTLPDALDRGFDFLSVPVGNKTADGRWRPIAASDIGLSVEQMRTRLAGHVRARDGSDVDSVLEQLEVARKTDLLAVVLSVPMTMLQDQQLVSNLTDADRPPIPFELWVRVPPDDAGWSGWTAFHRQLNYTPLAQALLDLRDPLVPFQERWKGELVSGVLLPMSVFATGGEGDSARQLPASVSEWVLGVMDLRQAVVIEYEGEGYGYPVVGSPGQSLLAECGSAVAETVAQEEERRQPATKAEKVERALDVLYQDVLVSLLAPIPEQVDESAADYFHSDPATDMLYEEALARCLSDRLVAGHLDATIVVSGGGRGALVQSVLNAVSKAKIKKWDVHVVEGSDEAVDALRKRVSGAGDLMWRKVKVTPGDLRTFSLPHGKRAHVLVAPPAENHHSPEYINVALKGGSLLARDGVVIPSEYSTFVTPVSTARLWTRLAQTQDLLQTPFLVHSKAQFFPARESSGKVRVEKVWSFHHPDSTFTTIQAGERSFQGDFTMSVAAVVHGLSKFFKATLYKDVRVSTLPGESVIGQLFAPLFVPFVRPLMLSQNDTLSVSMRRRVDVSRMEVWYEWRPEARQCEELGGLCGVHNAEGAVFNMTIPPLR
ncbi:unnamed protein product [Vitrella brassicaformis CCMP3155]|uniref:Uncharacterized protein n=2 Tax=Vitrella brassicaformis TaxID=1169539 RepID=A0A0G4EXM1_VITBC|nr:unnamed protein product [Vitrella brassicaformis CCMP3155]|eukprot:CEM04054.1 unnamed protein product [Vitrella brassicaformis CCMP3155]